jgi:hypothetical protein
VLVIMFTIRNIICGCSHFRGTLDIVVGENGGSLGVQPDQSNTLAYTPMIWYLRAIRLT